MLLPDNDRLALLEGLDPWVKEEVGDDEMVELAELINDDDGDIGGTSLRVGVGLRLAPVLLALEGEELGEGVNDSLIRDGVSVGMGVVEELGVEDGVDERRGKEFDGEGEEFEEEVGVGDAVTDGLELTKILKEAVAAPTKVGELDLVGDTEKIKVSVWDGVVD